MEDEEQEDGDEEEEEGEEDQEDQEDQEQEEDQEEKGGRKTPGRRTGSMSSSRSRKPGRISQEGQKEDRDNLRNEVETLVAEVKALKKRVRVLE